MWLSVDMSRYYPKSNLKGYKVSCNTFESMDLPCLGTGHVITTHMLPENAENEFKQPSSLRD